MSSIGGDLIAVIWPELADLRHLEGWTWQRMGPDLRKDGFCGQQDLNVSWCNCLIVFAPDDAVAVRQLVDCGPTWTEEGTVAEVLTALNKVPPPEHPDAPVLVLNRSMPLTVPQQTA